jgi:hypothetical protein
MTGNVPPGEAARALDEIRLRQAQVIETAIVPNWYWWLVGALNVELGVAVDTRTPMAIGVGVPVFVLGMLVGTGWVVRHAVHVKVRNDLLLPRGVLLLVSFILLVVGVTLALAFSLRAAGVTHPATLGNLLGALLLGAGGPVVMRSLRRMMLANRAGGGAR